MTTVTPILPTHLTLQPATLVVDREGRQNELRVDQVIRAVVTEEGDHRMLLDLGARRFLLPEGAQLRPGQQLDVRVVQTHPSLQLEVLGAPATPRVLPLLALAGQQLDWAGLAASILHHEAQLPVNLAPALQQPLQELQQALQGAPERPVPAALLAQLPQLLGLDTEHQALRDGHWPANLKTGLQAMLSTFRQGAPQPLLQQLGQVYDRLLTLPQRLRPAADNLPAELRPLQEQLQQLRPQLTAAERPLLQVAEERLAQVQTLLRQPWPELRPAATALGVPLLPEHPPDVPQPPDLATALLLLLGRRQGASADATGLRPAVEAEDLRQGLLAVKEALPEPGDRPSAAALQTLAGRLQRLLPQLSVGDRPLLAPFSEEVAGLALEAAPANDREVSELETRLAALLGRWLLADSPVPDRFVPQIPSVKTVLEVLLGLSLRVGKDPAAPQAEQGLRQLETLQQARSQLAEQGVQLVPLPFPFLDEGYLLVEYRQEQAGGEGEAPATHLTLLLRLQRLGNLQISLLYDAQGIYLRFVCQTEEARRTLQDYTGELGAYLGDVPLRSVSFSTGAEDPGAVVIRRAAEGQARGLDQRV